MGALSPEAEDLGYAVRTGIGETRSVDSLAGRLPGTAVSEDLSEDCLLDWTVYDRRNMSLNYDLGEIANRSFRDTYGI